MLLVQRFCFGKNGVAFLMESVLLRYGVNALKRDNFKLMSVVLRSGAGFPGGVAPTNFWCLWRRHQKWIFRARLLAKESAPTLRTTLFVEASVLVAHPSLRGTLLWHKGIFFKIDEALFKSKLFISRAEHFRSPPPRDSASGLISRSLLHFITRAKLWDWWASHAALKTVVWTRTTWP